MDLALYWSQPISDFVPDFGHPRDIATLEAMAEKLEREKKRQ